MALLIFFVYHFLFIALSVEFMPLYTWGCKLHWKAIYEKLRAVIFTMDNKNSVFTIITHFIFKIWERNSKYYVETCWFNIKKSLKCWAGNKYVHTPKNANVLQWL